MADMLASESRLDYMEQLGPGWIAIYTASLVLLHEVGQYPSYISIVMLTNLDDAYQSAKLSQ